MGPSSVTSQPFVWGGDEPIERRDAAGPTIDLFRYGWTQSGVSTYRTHDQAGSTRDVTNATAVVQARCEYDPFGRSTAVVATTLDPRMACVTCRDSWVGTVSRA